MIKFIATVVSVDQLEDPSLYNQENLPDIFECTFEEFAEWLLQQDELQLDVETPLIGSMPEARFRTVQFGEYAPHKDREQKDQYVLEWALLTKDQKFFILRVMNDKRVKKYIQNAAFEYQCFLNYGVVLENTMDTMISEKILYTGSSAILDEEGATFFSLESITRRRLEFELDKSYQKAFGFDIPLTHGHIVYAAQDVTVLDEVDAQQQVDLEKYYGHILPHERTVFNHLPTLEQEAVLAFGDIMYNGMKLDKEAWLKNASEAQPIIDKKAKALEEILRTDTKLYAGCIEMGLINLEDKVEINWNSPKDKLKLINAAFPDCPGSTRPILKKFLKTLEPDTAYYQLVEELSEGNFEPFFALLVQTNRDWLIENEFLVPANTLRINWNSTPTVVKLLNYIKPGTTSSDEETLNKITHVVAQAILDFRSAKMLTTTYGEKFLNKADIDGRVRTRFNQILETGRVSSADPNMQQIPVIEDEDPAVMNKYRNCFIPDGEDDVFVDSDYSSQELVVIASLSKDPVWMAALEKGHDLHSICAKLVFGEEWEAATLPSCKFVAETQKCKCPGHKRMRTGVKTINFGLAYGMSEFKLSATLKIPIKAAKNLIVRYFKTFPKIGGTLEGLGRFAVKNGYIMTLAPYYRKRWYPLWHKVKHLVEYHLAKIEHNALLGSIERTGKNTPIQGGSADMTKLAIVLIRRRINEKKLRASIKLKMQVHDQVTTQCKRHQAESWRVELTELMEQAAKVVIPSGLLKAETNICEKWEK